MLSKHISEISSENCIEVNLANFLMYFQSTSKNSWILGDSCSFNVISSSYPLYQTGLWFLFRQLNLCCTHKNSTSMSSNIRHLILVKRFFSIILGAHWYYVINYTTNSRMKLNSAVHGTLLITNQYAGLIKPICQSGLVSVPLMSRRI